MGELPSLNVSSSLSSLLYPAHVFEVLARADISCRDSKKYLSITREGSREE